MVLTRFKRLHPDLWCVECDLESGLVYWAFGEKDRAMYVMKRCLDDLQTLSQVICSTAAPSYLVSALCWVTLDWWWTFKNIHKISVGKERQF